MVEFSTNERQKVVAEAARNGTAFWVGDTWQYCEWFTEREWEKEIREVGTGNGMQSLGCVERETGRDNQASDFYFSTWKIKDGSVEAV